MYFQCHSSYPAYRCSSYLQFLAVDTAQALKLFTRLMTQCYVIEKHIQVVPQHLLVLT